MKDAIVPNSLWDKNQWEQKSMEWTLNLQVQRHSKTSAFREIGVPLSIRRDNSKMKCSEAWNTIMRKHNSQDKFTEPCNPQQNPAERKIGHLKNAMKRVFNDTNCAPQAWFCLACHCEDVLNHTALASLNWRTPMEKSTGKTPDISGLLQFGSKSAAMIHQLKEKN